MKTAKFQRRFYRQQVKSSGLKLLRVAVKETDLQILTDRPADKAFIQKRIGLYRRDIENYIVKDRRFLTALKPIGIELGSRPIIKEMAKAAQAAGVGPMAAVAGAIAQFLGRDLLKKGYKDVIIENGGDIFIKTTKLRRVAIFTGRQKLWRSLGLEIKPQDTPLGICASSGVIGHSLSFGRADSAVILSKNAALADAVATAAGNLVNTQNDLEKALRFIRSVKGILGAAIIIKKHLAAWGRFQLSA